MRDGFNTNWVMSNARYTQRFRLFSDNVLTSTVLCHSCTLAINQTRFHSILDPFQLNTGIWWQRKYNFFGPLGCYVLFFLCKNTKKKHNYEIFMRWMYIERCIPKVLIYIVHQFINEKFPIVFASSQATDLLFKAWKLENWKTLRSKEGMLWQLVHRRISTNKSVQNVDNILRWKLLWVKQRQRYSIGIRLNLFRTGCSRDLWKFFSTVEETAPLQPWRKFEIILKRKTTQIFFFHN